MGPEGAKTYPGSAVVQARAGQAGRAGRATQEIDYGRRGKGYIFGAFRPATGDALTRPYGGRGTASWVDFLERVELWLPAEAGRVYAIVDNLIRFPDDPFTQAASGHRWKRVWALMVSG